MNRKLYAVLCLVCVVSLLGAALALADDDGASPALAGPNDVTLNVRPYKGTSIIVHAQYGMFETQLGDSEYLAGDRFTNADITLAIAVDFAKMVKVVPFPDATPNIDRWHALVSERPAYSAS